MCESSVDIPVEEDANSAMVHICSFNVEDVQLWWPIGFGK